MIQADHIHLAINHSPLYAETFAFFLLLIGGGIWLANAMIDARKADECMSSGRRNCNPIEVAPR